MTGKREFERAKRHCEESSLEEAMYASATCDFCSIANMICTEAGREKVRDETIATGEDVYLSLWRRARTAHRSSGSYEIYDVIHGTHFDSARQWVQAEGDYHQMVVKATLQPQESNEHIEGEDDVASQLVFGDFALVVYCDPDEGPVANDGESISDNLYPDRVVDHELVRPAWPPDLQRDVAAELGDYVMEN